MAYPRVFEIVGHVTHIERIASGPSLHASRWLRDRYGPGDWSKRKGAAVVGLPDGTIRTAEVHWYEAHGVGRKKLKIKRRVD